MIFQMLIAIIITIIGTISLIFLVVWSLLDIKDFQNFIDEHCKGDEEEEEEDN